MGETMKIKLACGTDNGTEFATKHFGSSKYFLIYEFDLETKDLRFLYFTYRVLMVQYAL